MTASSRTSHTPARSFFTGAGASRRPQAPRWAGRPTRASRTGCARWGWSMSGTRPRDIEALIPLIEDRAALSFGWRGKRDCAGFAAAAIEAQTGVDVLAGLSWRSEERRVGKEGVRTCRYRWAAVT